MKTEFVAGVEMFLDDLKNNKIIEHHDDRSISEILISKIRFPAQKNLDPNLKAMIASVKKCGVMSPIIVCQRPRTYRLIAGRSRILACKALKLKTIPAMILNSRHRAYNEVVKLWLEGKW